ncbi:MULTISPECIES: hypothetical protein [unclassified Caulobacter]|jgi:hypothetical protein|uniref:hypothetical protein n=1 Tax=unclassified Caulobacter TaxID=2648921 RepID=UPI0006FB3A45|nr:MULTISPECIES: hypothetical protein [unclassified Caulobacter]KQV55326.1 hypothetical protein ASC62_22135 [Caulobacter sp. Root342]KQV63484.1 hypothetical protein ASC70_20510 [Caulobacter sp. Root343]
MKRFAIGLTAALAVAILVPAAVISAPKEEKGKPAIDAKAREAGMKEAPAIIQASGAGCTVSDARFIGEDKKAGAKYYEVACNEGMGFAMIAKKDVAPQVYTCLESSQPGPDGKVGGLACVLPGNANPGAGLAPYVKKGGVTCDIENTRAIGSGAKNSYFEVACKGGAGYVVQTVSPLNISGEVTVNSCLLYEEGGNVSCKLTNRQTQLAIVDTLNGAAKAAGTACDIKDKRYILSTKVDNYYEVACQDGKGYVFQQTAATGAFARAIPCAQAGFVGGGCTLTDAVAALTEQAGFYGKLSAKAGFPCDVEKYGMLPTNDPKKEIVELKCKGSDAGAIAVFTATGGTIYDCVTAELNGFRCSFTKKDPQYARLTKDLVGFNKASCQVSDARIIGATDTEGFVEVACSDGLPGWVLGYPIGVSKPAAKEFLSCAQAKGIGGGCKLPTNKVKG